MAREFVDADSEDFPEGEEANRKVSQANAKYRIQDEGAPDRCSLCPHFIAPDACDIVAGTISPDGVSDFFTPVSENEVAESSAGNGPDQFLYPEGQNA